jgi:hypothetical protein
MEVSLGTSASVIDLDHQRLTPVEWTEHPLPECVKYLDIISVKMIT